jgi:hypothetical protein
MIRVTDVLVMMALMTMGGLLLMTVLMTMGELLIMTVLMIMLPEDFFD